MAPATTNKRCSECSRPQSVLRRGLCPNCYRVWARDHRPPNAACAECGRRYFRRSGTRPTGQTCSRPCYARWKHGRDQHNELSPPAQLVTRACETCGTAFQTPQRQIDAGNGRFCSCACSGFRRRSPRGRLACERCGAMFERPVRRGLFSAGRFCSKSCQFEFLAVHALEREPARSRAYRALREAVVREHPFCTRCGDRQDLVVHHVLASRQRPDLLMARDNLQVLCRPCHTQLHSERGEMAHQQVLP